MVNIIYLFYLGLLAALVLLGVVSFMYGYEYALKKHNIK